MKNACNPEAIENIMTTCYCVLHCSLWVSVHSIGFCIFFQNDRAFKLEFSLYVKSVGGSEYCETWSD